MIEVRTENHYVYKALYHMIFRNWAIVELNKCLAKEYNRRRRGKASRRVLVSPGI